MKRIVSMVLLLALLLCGCGSGGSADPIVKNAVRREELPKDGSYILCKWTRVTGYDWVIASSAGLGQKDAYCWINGPSPLDLSLKYEFLISDSTYVFYVTDVREVYSEEMHMRGTEYTVSGWDVLYPVRRASMLPEIKSPGYIFESDLNGTREG